MSCRSQISWQGAAGIVEWLHPCQTHSLGMWLSLSCTRDGKGLECLCVHFQPRLLLYTLVLPTDPGPPSPSWSPISTPLPHLPSASFVQDYSLSPIAILGSLVMGLLTLYIPSQKSRETLNFILSNSTLIAGSLRKELDQTGQEDYGRRLHLCTYGKSPNLVEDFLVRPLERHPDSSK